VTPLFCISVDHLEVVAEVLKQKAMTGILEARYRPDKELKSSFILVDNSALKGARHEVPAMLRTGLDELQALTSKTLFGLPSVSPQR